MKICIIISIFVAFIFINGCLSEEVWRKRDPQLPEYFMMYEKRTVHDPTDNYGKGPWRYLTYGHGISYGSKEPGKVFEKGYGYIRALGRERCDLPKHLCPPVDDSEPFEYTGRKEPYYGYRPH